MENAQHIKVYGEQWGRWPDKQDFDIIDHI